MSSSPLEYFEFSSLPESTTYDDVTTGLQNRRAPLPPVKSQGVIFDDLEPIPINPNIDPPPYHCFNCWRRGHRYHDCQRPRSSILCHNCGRRGVIIKNCPRCSRAHKKHRERCERTATWIRATNDDECKEVVNRQEFSQIGRNLKEAIQEVFRSRGTPFMEDFVKLMHAIKHLPVDTQTLVVKKMIEEYMEMGERRRYWMDKLGEKY